MLNVLHLADALLSYAVGLLPEDPAELKRLADAAGDEVGPGDVYQAEADEGDEAVALASAAVPDAPASDVHAKDSRQPTAPHRQEVMRRTGS